MTCCIAMLRVYVVIVRDNGSTTDSSTMHMLRAEVGMKRSPQRGTALVLVSNRRVYRQLPFTCLASMSSVKTCLLHTQQRESWS